MGHFAKAAGGVGWPNPGWAPPGGYAGDTIVTDITHESAVQGINAFSAGIRLIAEDIAALPLIVYESLAQGGKRRAPEHPAYAMLHDAPNPEMTSMVFRETGIGHLYSWGNWYAEKELNGYGVAVRLWPLRPDRMAVEFDRDTGRRIYKYRLPNGTGVILPANRVFHVPGFGFDGLVGYSRVRLMRRSLEAAKVVEEYGLRTFANDARPGVTIKHPQKIGEKARNAIAESWDEKHRGLSNSERTAVLDEGMTLDATGFPPKDAQFLESRTFSVVEVARGLRIPPHKLSDLSRATFSNIEESNIDYVVSTLGPPCSRIEQQVGKDIIGPSAFFAEHLLDSQLRGKTLDRYMAYHMASGGVSWLNGDTIRARENMEPMPNDQGQVYLAPLNMTPIDLLGAAAAVATVGGPPTNGAKP
jgi:HK97 family phage portal protein